jgi:RNA polymerase sigma-70 factor, ECF subfamily
MSDFAQALQQEIPRMRRYALALTRRRDEVDDLVQDSLARAMAKQHLFAPGTDFGSWLFTLTRNQYVTNVRHAAVRGASINIDDVAWSLEAAADASGPLLLKELARAIEHLPFEQKQAIRLISFEGMRYEEVAKTLGVPIGTVCSRLWRARSSLRRLMGMKEDRPTQTDSVAA